MDATFMTGALLALGTAVFWAVSPVCWSSAGRRIGAFNVNLLRIMLASTALLIVLPFYTVLAHKPLISPTFAQWSWLLASGLSGIVLGDAAVYEALVRMGPRRTSQIGTITPIFSVLLAWLWLGEVLPMRALFGIAAVVGAIAAATYIERQSEQADAREPGRASMTAVLLAIGGSLLIGAGAVFGRQAFLPSSGPSLDPVLATTIRVVASGLMLWLIPLFRGNGAEVVAQLRDRHTLTRVGAGTLAGPIVGMLCYIGALKFAPAGVVSTLSSMSPLLIIPFVAVRYRAKIRVEAIVATIVALAGVALVCWRN